LAICARICWSETDKIVRERIFISVGENIVRKTIVHTSVAIAILPLIACTSLPDFNTLGVGQLSSSQADKRTEILPSDVAQHIKCELYYGMHPEAAPRGEPILSPADAQALQGYVVSVDLYLKVDDDAGGSPSVSFIDPYAGGTPQSFSFGFNGQLGGTRERTYSESFLINLNKELTVNGCATQAKGGASINGINMLGDVGLMDVAHFGLNSIPADDKSIQPASVASGYVTVAADGSTVQPKPAFGSTVQFTLSRSIGLNPTWTFQQFKGPTGAAAAGSAAPGAVPGAFLGYGRTDTHQLWIAFSYPAPTKPPPPNKALAAAQSDFEAAETRLKSLNDQHDAYIARLPQAQRNLVYRPNDPFAAQIQQAQNDAQRAQDKINTERQIEELTQRLANPLSGIAGAAANNRGIINNMQIQNLPSEFVH
jgi:hypothetical protein